MASAKCVNKAFAEMAGSRRVTITSQRLIQMKGKDILRTEILNGAELLEENTK
jgi:hypothetical protein